MFIHASFGSGSFRSGVGTGPSAVAEVAAGRSVFSIVGASIGWEGTAVLPSVTIGIEGTCPVVQEASRVNINKRKDSFCFIILIYTLFEGRPRFLLQRVIRRKASCAQR